MSRPPAYKNTNLDTRVNLSKNSTSLCHGRRRLELPGIDEILLLTISFSIHFDRKTRRAVQETNLPGVHRGGARRKSRNVSRSIRAPDNSSRVMPAFMEARIAFNVLGLISPRPDAKRNAAVCRHFRQA